MAFNFAHLLSAAYGGAPRRLGRLLWGEARALRGTAYRHAGGDMLFGVPPSPQPYLRPCYHALRHPFGAADRAMLLN